MILVFCALYEEAKVFIERLKLVKANETRFDLYEGEEISLAITGCGGISAAVVSSICMEKLHVKKEDYIINVGVCAGNSLQHGLYQINKITEEVTGRTFFPDMLVKTDLNEAEILSKATVQDTTPQTLCDMEAAGIYQAAIKFVYQDRILIFKTVLDKGIDSLKVTPAQVVECMQEAFSVLEPLIFKLVDNTAIDKRESLIKNVCEIMQTRMCASVTMQSELEQLIRYLLLSGKDIVKIAGKTPIFNTRREGKIYLNELKQNYI